MRQVYSLAVLLVLLLVPNARAVYTSGGPVKLLSVKNFNTAILDSDVPAVVEFYAPWCGHCQQLAPTYQRVAENLHGVVTVAAVDCDVEANKPLCGRYEVRGFPTLKVFPGDKPKSGRKLPTDYQGPRSAKGIADAATAGLHSRLVQRPKTAADFGSFRSASPLPKVVLFTDKPKTTALCKSLSMRFRDRLAFAEVRDATGAVAGTFGVSSTPALLVVPGEGEPVMYEGKLRAKDLVEFLKPFAGLKGGTGAKEKANKGGGSEGNSSGSEGNSSGSEGRSKPFAEPQTVAEQAATVKAEVQEAVQDLVSAVVDLTAADLPAVLEGDGAWLFGMFEGPEGPECEASAADLVQLAMHLGGAATVGRINASAVDADTLEENGIEAALKPEPAGCAHRLVLKPYGEQSEPDEPFPVFEGNATAKAVQSFVLAGFPEAAVAKLTTESMPNFMSADGGSAPRVVLFTNKDEAPPLFRALAANIRPATGAVFGAVHERETEVLQNFKITKVPTMSVAWVAETEQKDEAGRPLMGARLQQYRGPLKYGRMAEFLRFVAGLIAAAADDPSAGLDKPLAPPLQQLNSTADLDRLCTQRLGLCVIGFLNPAAVGHADTLQQLGAVALKQSEQPLHFAWANVRQQAAFAAALGVAPGDAPTAVVLSPRRQRYAVLQGGLTHTERLDALLARVLAGRQPTIPLQGGLPGLEDTAAAGAATDAAAEAAAAGDDVRQGGDAGAATEEDEFDLADLMAEQLEGGSDRPGRQDVGTSEKDEL